MLKIRKAACRLREEKGLSLIEIVIILVILGISIAPISQLSIQNLNYGGRYITMMRGLYYAQSIMENIIADYNSGNATIGGYANVRSRWPGSTPSPPTGITGTVSISGEATLNGVNYVTVLVRISGEDIPDIELSTMLVDNT